MVDELEAVTHPAKKREVRSLTRKLFSRKLLIRVFGGLIGIFVIFVAALAVVHGPVAAYRLVVSTIDTQIDDYLRYPGRQLVASGLSFSFAVAEREEEFLNLVLQEFGNDGTLESILEANDSIAFLAIQGDRIIFERYFQGHTPVSRSQAFSMSKSFPSALIGMAIDDGYLEGVDQSITDFVPELSAVGFDGVRIHDLLNMMSGSSYVENDDPFGEHVAFNFTDQLEREILSVGMEREPGTLFRYKTGDNALLALVLDRALGAESISEYTQRRMWTPLGMQDDGVWTIDHEGDGLEKSWCCLAASARDFAKLGRLYLDGGIWGDEQLLSAKWIEQSTNGQVPKSAWPDENAEVGWWNYGYQWWLASRERGDYFALEKDGQFLYVNPERDLIIVRLGWSPGDLRISQWIEIFQRIADQIT